MTNEFRFVFIGLSINYLVLNLVLLLEPIKGDKDVVLKLLLLVVLIFNSYNQVKRIKYGLTKTYNLYQFKKYALNDAVFLFFIYFLCRTAPVSSIIALITCYLFYGVFIYMILTLKGFHDELL